MLWNCNLERPSNNRSLALEDKGDEGICNPEKVVRSPLLLT